MLLYAWKIFHENAIEMFLIIPSNRESEAPVFRKYHNFVISHRNQWKQLVLVNERVSWVHSWRIPFSVVPIHGTVHHKNESWSDGSSLFRKTQKCSFVKCTWVIGNFSLMLSIYCKSEHSCINQHLIPIVMFQHSILGCQFPLKHEKRNIFYTETYPYVS